MQRMSAESLRQRFTEPEPTLLERLSIETASYNLELKVREDPAITHVPMDGARIIRSGQLFSWGFTGCSGLVIQQHSQDGNAALFHLVGNQFSEEQQAALEHFGRDEPVTTFFIGGGIGTYDTDEVESYVLGYFRNPDSVAMKAHYDDVGSRFHLLYNANEQRLFLHAYGGGASGMYPLQGAHVVSYDLL